MAAYRAAILTYKECRLCNGVQSFITIMDWVEVTMADQADLAVLAATAALGCCVPSRIAV